jgi:signal transduction histidine kinase
LQGSQLRAEGVPFRLPVEEELIARVAWLIRLRWIAALGVILAIGVAGCTLHLFVQKWELLSVAVAIAGYNTVFYGCLKNLRRNPSAGIEQFSRFAAVQFFVDWLALILLAHYTGGIDSPVIFYFIFHVIIASILLPPRACYFHAAIGVGLVCGLALLEYFAILPHESLPSFHEDHFNQPVFVAGTLFFFSTSILVSTYLATSITRQLWARTRQLARLKERLESALHKSETLYEIAQAVTSTLNFKEVLDRIARLATQAINAKGCSIRLLDAERRLLLTQASFGLSEEYLGKGPIEVEKSQGNRETLRGKVVVVLDATQDPGFQYPREAEKEGIHSVISLPLSVRANPFGVLRLYTGEVRRFTEEEIAFLSALANQGAVAIENARAYRKLEELEKAKSDFVFTVAHELKGPMAAIQSLLQVLQEGYAGQVADKQKGLIGRMERRLAALQSLIRDLLALGALKGELPAAKATDVVLNDVARLVVETMQPEAEKKGVELTVEIPGTPLTIRANAEDLERLLGNLLQNAIHYTPAHRTVRLRIAGGDRSLSLVVADTGIGIPPESIGHIFEEFYRARNAKEMGEGTGLGLSLVKKIVDRYHGEVTVASKLGEGTSFQVILPRG